MKVIVLSDEVGFTVKNNVEVQLGDEENDLLNVVEAYKRA